jgi:dGTPase
MIEVAPPNLAAIMSNVYRAAANISQIGYLRTELTSTLVGSCIDGVRLNYNSEIPALSEVKLELETLQRVEVLKNFAYTAVIESPKLKISEYRGKDIVKGIYEALMARDGYMLLPADFRELFNSFKLKHAKRRVVCDFIAGMTDRYAVQFYNRISSTTPESIYSPL